MQELLVKMAKEAATNDTLIASFIQAYCQRNNTTWADVARQLNSTEEQLAKLALCRRPKTQTFTQDLVQISHYTNLSVDLLTTFMQPNRSANAIKHLSFKGKLPSLQTFWQSSLGKKRALTFAITIFTVLLVSTFLLNQFTAAKDTATLHVSSGEAIVTQAGILGSSTTTVTAGTSIILSTADMIAMTDNSTAELFLFEGSQVDLAANTRLELTELANNESDHQIYMTLFNGRIINRVTKLLGIDDAYEVRTPSSTASVRGTIFSVTVLDQQTTEVAVTEGVVEVALDNESAYVQAGEMITAVSGQPLKVEPNNNLEIILTATPLPINTDETEENGNSTENLEETDSTNESITTDTPTASSVKPTKTPTTPDNIDPTITSSGPPATTDGSPVPSTNTPDASSPTNTPASSVPPTNTPLSPPTNTPLSAPTNTPLSSPTNTPLPPPTNTPLPPATNTNTPLPPPTNTPLPPPTNTPLPPPTDTPIPPPTSTSEPSTVTLCHNPGPSQQTIQVSPSAVQGHLDHGDYLGACN